MLKTSVFEARMVLHAATSHWLNMDVFMGKPAICQRLREGGLGSKESNADAKLIG